MEESGPSLQQDLRSEQSQDYRDLCALRPRCQLLALLPENASFSVFWKFPLLSSAAIGLLFPGKSLGCSLGRAEMMHSMEVLKVLKRSYSPACSGHWQMLPCSRGKPGDPQREFSSFSWPDFSLQHFTHMYSVMPRGKSWWVGGDLFEVRGSLRV